MTRSITDAAIVLSVIAGKDPNDNFTLAQPSRVPDYTKALNKHSLRGKRIGVPRRFLLDLITANGPFINQVFQQALNTLKSLGATIVDPADFPSADELVSSKNETIVLEIDFKVCPAVHSWTVSVSQSIQIELGDYLASLIESPSGVRTLQDVINFNNLNAAIERPAGFESQDMYEFSRFSVPSVSLI